MQKYILVALTFASLMIGSSDAATYYLAPTGNDSSGAGTQASPWLTIGKGVTAAVAGDTILMRGGVYNIQAQTVINKSGTPGNPIKLWNFPGELPILDAASMPIQTTWVIYLKGGSWWHFKGLEEKNNRYGSFIAMFLSASNVTVENCNIHHNAALSKWAGSGIGVYGNNSNILILNNDSHNNRDNDGRDAGGFQFGTTGTGLVVRGNRVYQNSDDGMAFFCTQDNRNCPGATIENNWSFENGYDASHNVLPGNGNGFKLGGIRTNTTGTSGGNLFRNNVAWGNRSGGFDENGSQNANTGYNNTAYNNNQNFKFFDPPSDTLKNNLVLGALGSAKNVTASFNSWQTFSPPITVNNADFVTLNDTCMRGPRQADGSLPVCGFLHLVSGSDLIDKGTTSGVTVAYNGAAPDLGAFEFSGSGGGPASPTVSITAPTSGAFVSGPAVAVSANASDDLGVSGVQFKIDGSNLGAEDTTSPYGVSWNTTVGFPDGAHTVSAVARDAAGNVTTSAIINVTVRNSVTDTTPPSVSISEPSAGTGVSGNPTIVTASATDDVGVVGVQFKLDGANLGAEDTVSPYTINWDTSVITNGAHMLSAVARDAAPNTATSAGVLVTGINGIHSTFWGFDGATPEFDSQQGNRLILGTGASFTAGRDGDALTLNGTTGSATASETRGLTATSALTLAVWLKRTDAVGLDVILAKGTPATNRGFLLGFNGTALVFQKIGAATVLSTVTVPTGAWHHVAVTWLESTGNVKFYLDGVLSQTIVDAPAIPQYLSTDPLTVGAVTGESFFNGQLDDVTIYNSALSDAAVMAIATPDATPPTVAVTAPADNSTVSGTVNITASAGDDVGVTQVQFQLDQVNLGAADLTSPYAISWDTLPVSNGLHSITAIASDASGKSTESEIITANVDNSDTMPPTINITAPAEGAIVFGTTSLSALATDNQGVAGVQFRLDGVNYGAELTSSRYTVALLTTTLPKGSHTLVAVSRDLSSNTTTSPTRNFTVANTLTNKVQYSVALQNQQLQAVEASCGTQPKLDMIDGVKPADLSFPDNGQVLASMTLPVDWLEAPVNGVIAQKGVWRDPAANASGNLVYARFKTSGGVPCMQGPITLTGGGGLITFPRLNVTVGEPLSVSGFTLRTHDRGNGRRRGRRL